MRTSFDGEPTFKENDLGHCNQDCTRTWFSLVRVIPEKAYFQSQVGETAGLEVGAALCAAGGVQLIIMLVLANM